MNDNYISNAKDKVDEFIYRIRIRKVANWISLVEVKIEIGQIAKNKHEFYSKFLFFLTQTFFLN